MDAYRPRLPYIDNTKAILVTVAINLAVVFLFAWPEGVAYADILWDSAFCALITTAIDMWIVYARLKKMRSAGDMPCEVPESAVMQRLPQNPIALGAVYAIAFAVLTVGCNAFLLLFFGIRSMTFAGWAAYKLVYATVLSLIIVEYCIFRYVQPDWANREKGGNLEKEDGIPAGAVRNPLPKIGVFKAMYGAVTANIAMNILLGSLLGGAIVAADGSVVIRPTTVEGIPITGLVFGFIVGLLVTGGVVATVNAIILDARDALLAGAVPDRRIAWMPKGRLALASLVCLCVMAFSAVALPTLMTLFGLTILNFYQFTVLITIYATLIGKALSAILTRRCMQPDYIEYVLKRNELQVE